MRDGTEEQRDAGALQRPARRSASTSSRPRATAPPTVDRRDPARASTSCSRRCRRASKLRGRAGRRRRACDHAVRNVQEALIEGALLTVLVVFLFLNSWRSTVITGLALPVSVLASFIAVWAFGFTLNTMSLLGLSLAIGILIDDAIVVRENIVRHVEMGKDHYDGGARGHRRDRPRGRGDDVLDRRGVRADRASWAASAGSGSSRSRSRSPARCWCRCSCRSRSTRCSRPTGPIPQTEAHERRKPIARDARPLQPLVRPAGRPLQGRHRLGARPPAGDGAARRRHVRRRARDVGEGIVGARLRAGERPERDQHDRSRRRRARTWSTPGSRRRRPRGSPARTPRCATPTPRSARPCRSGAVGGRGAHLRAAGAEGRARRSARTRWGRSCGTR